MNVSLTAVTANLGVLLVLLAAKMVPKIAFLYPSLGVQMDGTRRSPRFS